MSASRRCHIDPASGKLVGPASISYNDPWPTPNCTPGGFGVAFGGVIHTEVGFEHSVIAEFNNPSAQASAFFSIGMDGHIHQYMALGKNLMAWTQSAGNPHYRGVEHEDRGHPETPMTDAQLTASAQVFEAMSTFDGWPLAATANPSGGRGILFHSDGGAAWGGHACPGPVRMKQRDEVIRRARALRNPPSPPVPPAVTEKTITTTGKLSLAAIATAPAVRTTPMHILHLTCDHFGGFPPEVAAWGNDVFAGRRDAQADVPAGLKLRLPVVGQ
jgi:hypothetical protein